MPSGRLRFRVLLLASLLLARDANAQIPPASPLGILSIPASQVPQGASNAVGIHTRLDVSSGRVGPVRADLLATVSNWDRVELTAAVPLRFDGTSRIAVAPLHLDGKLVLRRRPEDARGFGVALRLGSDLPFDDIARARFTVELGIVADLRFARDILLAAHLALAGSARYRVEDRAFQSIAWGLGLRVPLSTNLALLGELLGEGLQFGILEAGAIVAPFATLVRALDRTTQGVVVEFVGDVAGWSHASGSIGTGAVPS